MSHEVETMAYVGEVPWHGLGKQAHPDLTPEQFKAEAGVDFAVEKVPAYIQVNGAPVRTGQSALVRKNKIADTKNDNRILSMVSDQWVPVQNDEAFNFFNDFIMAGDMEMHTAGSLKNGELVWALAKVKESFTILGRDTVDSYLLFTNPHSFGSAIDVRFTPIRVVCNNTLTLALGSGETGMTFKATHRRAFQPEVAKQALGIASNKLNTYKEYAELLAGKAAPTDLVQKYFGELFPKTSEVKDSDPNELSRNAKRALEVLETQPGHDLGAGTWWQPFNAVTYMVDHELGRTQDNRLTSAWYGSGRSLKNQALKKAVELALV